MPVSYNQKDASNVWPVAGPDNKPLEYQGVLQKVEDTTSKIKPDGTGGNPMQVWTVDVYNAEGAKRTIKDYVVIPGATFKIKQLAKALGKEAEFKANKFQADDHIGASFLVTLNIEDDDTFGEQNKLGKYLAPRKVAAGGADLPAWQQNPPKGNSPVTEEKVFQEADIPF
jgi:hypothetical protein